MPWAAHLKKACPTVYTFPYDDQTSTFTCFDGDGPGTENYVNTQSCECSSVCHLLFFLVKKCCVFLHAFLSYVSWDLFLAILFAFFFTIAAITSNVVPLAAITSILVFCVSPPRPPPANTALSHFCYLCCCAPPRCCCCCLLLLRRV